MWMSQSFGWNSKTCSSPYGKDFFVSVCIYVYFKPAIAALIGLIPNCAASVILTQLYLSGAISFSSVIAGLCTGAGIGLVVLFKVNPDKKENIKIIAVLYVIAVIAGLILELTGV